MIITASLCRGKIAAVGRRQCPDYFLPAPAPTLPVITPQPLRVLAALANSDLPITELAEKLFISPITAHQHITAARKAMGTRTNVGAIKRAMQLGMIAYTDDTDPD